jgi:CrcB protein
MNSLALKQVLAIAAGGALGSVLRYGLSTWVHSFAGRGFPYGTLAVNVAGCLVMGFLFVLLVERVSDNTLWRAALLIGVLGGFTTFSSFSIETFNLIEDGLWLKAMLNAAGSLVLCVGATWIGVAAARAL